MRHLALIKTINYNLYVLQESVYKEHSKFVLIDYYALALFSQQHTRMLCTKMQALIVKLSEA